MAGGGGEGAVAWGCQDRDRLGENTCKAVGQASLDVHPKTGASGESGNAGDIRHTDSIPGLGSYPGGRHGNPLQYSCLENPMDRGGWQATVHRVAKSQTLLK